MMVVTPTDGMQVIAIQKINSLPMQEIQKE
jgi:hypothetical protein